MSWEDYYGRSHDADHIGGHISDLCDELKKLRLAVEDGVGLIEQIMTRSTAGTAGTSPQS